MKLWFAMTACAAALAAHPVFNVKDYGATGLKQENARQALQQAIDACGRAGGSTVYVPPGEYTCGQLRLRSGVRLYVEAGATLFASLDGKEFYEGRGTIDGQASYQWRPNDSTDYYIRPNQLLMEATAILRPWTCWPRSKY